MKGMLEIKRYVCLSLFILQIIIDMNVRIHPDEAKAANFDSEEILDGSGDVFATPVVFHNLHCLVSTSN